ncbi:MAG TPA: hypothetical protein VMQ56_14740 [Terracidiphilus sp.]|jgi:hypothetical protein|nr:hypothetical protein [Terracidiphilus sp.]
MKGYKAILLLAILLPAFGLAEKKKHNDVPEAFAAAHSVYVEAEDGDYSKPGVSAADRKAIEDVQDAVQAWRRYTLAVHPEQADLILVVRKGLSSGGVDSQSGLPTTPRVPNGQTSVRAPGQPGDADSMGPAAQLGAEGDRLLVYSMTADGKRKGPVWTRELQGGLDAPSNLLVQQLKSAVERAYPAPSPAANPTP